jgi:hypothetical protein
MIIGSGKNLEPEINITFVFRIKTIQSVFPDGINYQDTFCAPRLSVSNTCYISVLEQFPTV